MEQYYDLVMVTAIARYAKKNLGMKTPGVAPVGASEGERWRIAKKDLYGSKYGLISEWGGLIDFDPDEYDRLVGKEKLTYDEYLDAQRRAGSSIRDGFLRGYYEAAMVFFKGKIERINKTKGRLCFERIFIDGVYAGQRGECFEGKEDHVWLELSGFEDFRVGDCLAFEADIYRYVKTGGGQGKMVDYGLRNPENIQQIEEYELPSDEKLRLQDVDNIICGELCMHKEHCYGICLANAEWRETMRNTLLGKI